MARSDLTELVLVVDRSGSMYSTLEDAQGGINSLIEDQKKVQGEALLTLVEFNDVREIVQNRVPVQQAEPYVLHPGGGTALLDAIGRTIDEVGRTLADLDEEGRPGLVIFAVVTDGQENSSRKYSRSQVKEMIERQRGVYSWQFVFLGSDQSTFLEAESLGFTSDTVVKYAGEKTEATYASLSGKIGVARCCSMEGSEVSMAYTEHEKSALDNDTP